MANISMNKISLDQASAIIKNVETNPSLLNNDGYRRLYMDCIVTVQKEQERTKEQNLRLQSESPNSYRHDPHRCDRCTGFSTIHFKHSQTINEILGRFAIASVNFQIELMLTGYDVKKDLENLTDLEIQLKREIGLMKVNENNRIAHLISIG